MSVPKSARRIVWIGVFLLIFIGVAAVARRTIVLLFPGTLGSGGSSPAAALDAGFAHHSVLTLLHILPGALFLTLAAVQFMPSVRQKHLSLHRWSGSSLVVIGLIIGISALVMSYKMNIGGPNETAATTLYAIVFLICISKAYLFARRREIARHREWMIRAYAVALGVATTRPIVGAFFAFRRLTPHEFFGIAFWLGFTLTFMVAEAWIDYTRTHGPDNLAINPSASPSRGRTNASVPTQT
jgi:uncharacterized membrane protein